MTVKCPECRRENPANTGFCISCGADLPQGETEKPAAGAGSVSTPVERQEESAMEVAGVVPPGAQEPPGGRRTGTGWKIAVAVLSIAVLVLAGTTAYFAIACQQKNERVKALSVESESLSNKIDALPFVLEGLEAVSRQAVKVIEKYYPGDPGKTGEWQDYVTDSLETIEELSSIYREYLEGGELENTDLLETIEKIVNEFLDSGEEGASTK